MAYIKYKELTKYFNFNKEINPKDLPTYVTDYLSPGETIFSAHQTRRDKGIFTNKSMILFDVEYFLGITKKIHIIPYKSISSSAILFSKTSGAILLSMDSGYQIRLNFVGLDADEKKRLRLLYCHIIEKIK